MYYSSAGFGIWEYYQSANKTIRYVLTFMIVTFVQVGVIDSDLVFGIAIQPATQVLRGFAT